MTTPWEWAGNLSAALSAVHALGAIWHQPWAESMRRRVCIRQRSRVEKAPRGSGPALTVHISVQVPADSVCTVWVVTGPRHTGRGAGQ